MREADNAAAMAATRARLSALQSRLHGIRKDLTTAERRVQDRSFAPPMTNTMTNTSYHAVPRTAAHLPLVATSPGPEQPPSFQVAGLRASPGSILPPKNASDIPDWVHLETGSPSVLPSAREHRPRRDSSSPIEDENLRVQAIHRGVDLRVDLRESSPERRVRAQQLPTAPANDELQLEIDHLSVANKLYADWKVSRNDDLFH